MQKSKPHLIVNLSNEDSAINIILEWINQNHVETLNIGGPSESSWPGIHHKATLLFQELFFLLTQQSKFSL